jgi:hypothetical protein
MAPHFDKHHETHCTAHELKTGQSFCHDNGAENIVFSLNQIFAGYRCWKDLKYVLDCIVTEKVVNH